MRSPLVARANPSAMLTATRSVRVMIGRMPINEAEFSSRFSGKPTMNSAPSRCSSSAIRSAIERLSQLVYHNTAYT